MSVTSIAKVEFNSYASSLEKPEPKKEIRETSSLSKREIQWGEKPHFSLYYGLNCIGNVIQKTKKQFINSLVRERCQEHSALEKASISNPKKDVYYQKCIEIDVNFLKKAESDGLCYNVSEAINDIDEIFMEKSTTLDIPPLDSDYKKMLLLAHLVDEFIFNLYKLDKSKWHPSDPIECLDVYIRLFGPMVLRGAFAQGCEQSTFENVIDGATFYAWCPSSVTKKPHNDFIVITGVDVFKKIIYFIDPIFAYHPKNPKEKKVYTLTLEQLQAAISNLYGCRVSSSPPAKNEEGNFALFGCRAFSGRWRKITL